MAPLSSLSQRLLDLAQRHKHTQHMRNRQKIVIAMVGMIRSSHGISLFCRLCRGISLFSLCHDSYSSSHSTAMLEESQSGLALMIASASAFAFVSLVSPWPPSMGMPTRHCPLALTCSKGDHIYQTKHELFNTIPFHKARKDGWYSNPTRSRGCGSVCTQYLALVIPSTQCILNLMINE